MIEVKKYNITIRLNREQLEQLLSMSEAIKVSRAEILRQALERMYKEYV